MRPRRDRTVGAVAVLTVLALGLRLALLGHRVAHFDEARVAYWIVEYRETGVLFYRPIIHGPLLQLLNTYVFGLFGMTDFTMRLVPALVGGLLPLSALLLRHRLRDETVVSLALLLALNPVLLYYSRFMRGDVVAGGLSFLAFVCLVRAVDFDDGRYLYAATVSLAVGLGAKENVLAYVLAFVGATGLLLHHRLLFARFTDRTPLDTALAYLLWAGRGVRRHATAVLGSIGAFLATIVLLYAPRGSLPSQRTYYFSCLSSPHEPMFDAATAPTLGEALANPLRIPELVTFTLGSTVELYRCQWIGPRTSDPNPYVEFLGQLSLATVDSSTALVLLAVAGFLGALYAGDRPDDLVSFGFYWGAASIVGYPFITDIGGAGWLVVHVVLPLSIPAAVALGALARWGRAARENRDWISVALVVALVAVLVGSMGVTAYATSYDNPYSPNNPLVQYAQPAGDLEPTIHDVHALAARNDGTDVVLYGEHLYNPVDDELERRPTCSNWFNALPLPWYLEAGDVDADCAENASMLDAALRDDPPVIVAHANERGPVEDRVGDRYDARRHRMRATDTPFVFYVDESRLE
jgi:uncharacterized protein (TIGR03663 family)